MKKNLLFAIMIFFFLFGCNNKKEIGKNVVKCPEKPLNGLVKLKIKKVLTIDSLIIDEEKPPLFEFMTRDKHGNIFIGSNRPEICIFKFASSGVFLKEFLRKGEGPGELRAIHMLQIIDNSIMVSSDIKTTEYDMNGNYISEKRLKKQYNNITFIDKQNFIANYYKIDENNNSIIRRICSIINKSSEEVSAELLKFNRENIGRLNIKDNEGKTAFTLSVSGITPDYNSIYCEENKSIYQCLTAEPQIYIKNKNGDLIKAVKRNFKGKIFSDVDKEKKIASFKRLPDDMKILLKKSFPKKLTAISELKLLPKGYFAVYFNKNFDKNEICIFNEDGTFHYIIEFPDEISSRLSIFTRNGFASIERIEDRDLCVEYKITNLPEIFNDY